jgi:putative nucleotidyltransferase with HDIG domain
MNGGEEPLALARRVLAGQQAWVVGGLLRDRALRSVAPSPLAPSPLAPSPAAPSPGPVPSWRGAQGVGTDLDLVVSNDPAQAARALARAATAASFRLSAELGAWRVVARDGSWQIDVEPLRGGTLEADLRLRDFTVNAVAQSLDGAQTYDPLGGLEDLARRRLRAVAPGAFADDPLRVLRLVRLAVNFALAPDASTLAEARAWAAAVGSISAERVFTELKLIVGGPDPTGGLSLMDDLGLTRVVLPELAALAGVEQSRFHDRDVLGHTLEVLRESALLADQYVGNVDRWGAPLASEPTYARGAAEGAAEILGAGHREAISSLLAEPLGDDLTRGDALRWGALLHDAAKPATRTVRPDGRVTFVGHDTQGAELARAVLRRLRASERLGSHVAALVRHHLRLGFLVHERQPLDRRLVYGYLRASEPVEVDVTLLSVADRLATRGYGAQEAIDAHLALARVMIADALRWRAQGAPRPLWRGDELAGELGIARGPHLGELLEAMREAQYVGEVSTRAQALAQARTLLASGARPA